MSRLVLAAIVPMWLVSGLLILHAYRDKQAHIDADLSNSVFSLTKVVDQNLSKAQVLLQALATSPAFGRADLQGVQQQAEQLLRWYPGANILVADASGQELLNCRRPYGSPLPQRNSPEIVLQVFQTGRPAIGNLYQGAVSKLPLVSIDVPVILDGKVAYDLALTIPCEQLSSILGNIKLPEGGYCTILDGNRAIIARIPSPTRYIGKKPHQKLLNALQVADKGTLEGTNLDGMKVFVTFCKSSLSPWTIVVGVNKAAAMGGLLLWTALVIAGTIAISLLGLACAGGYARKITRSVQSLADLARPIERGEPFVVTQAHDLQETEDVARALEQAADLLKIRAAERDQAASALGEMNETLQQEVLERNRAEAELRQKWRLFNAIIEGTSDAIFVKDADGRYLLFNSAAARVVGKEVSEVLGRQDADIFPLGDAHTMREEDQEVMTSGLTKTYEDIITDVHGKKHVFLCTKGPLHGEDGEVRGTFGVSRDITGQKMWAEHVMELNETLKTAKEQADAANLAKSAFLANMSHEIRTPMNGVLGMLQLLEMTDLSVEQRGYLDDIRTSGKNLLSLINDILDLSKIEAGKVTLEHDRLDLQLCISQVVQTQKSAIFGKRLSLVVAGQAPAPLLGDQLRVKQIILNLLSNAVKFTRTGGITITTRVLEKKGGSVLVEIAVEDTGIGIAADALERIFEPFTQESTATVHQFGGTGLGLAISRRLATLMGGSISARSTPGVGSCFRLSLPFPLASKAAATSPAGAPALRWDGPTARILLVEDNPINVKFAAGLLQKFGHQVVSAFNGPDCLAFLERDRFDLVLMDIQIPLLNGEEVLREIRRKEHGSNRHQQVLAVTAYSLSGERERFLQLGFDGYLSKPLEAAELLQEIKRALNLSDSDVAAASGANPRLESALL